MHGEIPQWSPFMTHGSMAFLGYIAPSGIFQNVLFLSGGLLKEVNFLPLFYAGIFLDELLLLTGVWLLARRFVSSPFTVFFIAVSVMGSCIWVLQPWWNFHLYYAIPLILYLVHVFLDSGKWRYYFLAGNLLFIQSLGNLPYFLPVTSLVIFLYFLFYITFNYEDTWPKLKALRFGPAFVTATAFIILSLGILYYAMTFGTDQIANYNVLRNPDGTTSLDGFLTYGGQFNWRAWLELILGISPFLDYTLYIGILGVPFIVLGLIANTTRRNLHFLLLVVVLLLFSMGTFVSVFFYYAWPMMKFFRHLVLVFPLIKVFLCFLAGFGLEAVLFNKFRLEHPKILKAALALAALSMIGLSLFLWGLSNNYHPTVNLLLTMVPAKHTFFRSLLDESVLIPMLNRASTIALLSFIVFMVLFFTKKQKSLLVLAVLIPALHCADIYGFKVSEMKLKTAPLNDSLYQIIDFQSMPYAPGRDVSFGNNNPRAELLKVLPIQYAAFFNWSTHAFLFKDELDNPFRTDHWLLPLDHYMRAYWGQPLYDLSDKPLALSFGFRMEFPKGHPAVFKISGVTQDKIQFFSAADFIASDEAMAALMTHPRYTGDSIFLSVPEDNRQITAASPPDNDLSANKRLNLAYQVTRFDANNIEISADNTSSNPVWLFYSDVWHPLWRATVNGKPTPVYKANLAYKAVRLEPGSNNVHFYFKSTFMSVLYLVFSLNALLWLMIILYLTGNIVLNKRPAQNG